MSTDHIVFGTLKPQGDHWHLTWTCPDCGKRREAGSEPRRYVECGETLREYLVIGISERPQRRTTLLSPCEYRRATPTKI